MRVKRLILLFLICLWMVPSLPAVEYFDVVGHKYKPVKLKIIVEPDDYLELRALRSIIQQNLEKSLMFELELPEHSLKKADRPQMQEPDFILKFFVKKVRPLTVDYTLHTAQTQKQLLTGELLADEIDNIRKEALQLADEIYEAALKLPGLALTQIAFAYTTRNKRKNVMLVDFDGTQLKRFSFNLGTNRLPFWAYDQRHISYTNFTATNSNLHIQSLRSLQSTVVSLPNAQILGGSWSPDGTRILMTILKDGDADLYRYDIQKNSLGKLLSWNSLETSPVYSPDGRYFAFVSDRTGFQKPQIYLYELATSQTRRLTFHGHYNSSPKWSPDSKMIAYEGQVGDKFQLFRLHIHGGQPKQLTHGAFNAEKPDWSPNGQLLVFASDRSGVYKLYYIPVNGGPIKRVTQNPEHISEHDPAWSHQAVPFTSR